MNTSHIVKIEQVYSEPINLGEIRTSPGTSPNVDEENHRFNKDRSLADPHSDVDISALILELRP